jgi:hypothetical protein
LDKDTLGDDGDILRSRGEEVRTSLSDEVLNKLQSTLFCYEPRKWGWTCRVGKRRKIGNSCWGIFWEASRDGELGCATVLGLGG